MCKTVRKVLARYREASTLQDIAGKEGVSERFIGRMIWLAHLAPGVLEALAGKCRPPTISINEMVEVAKLPWGEQVNTVLGLAPRLIASVYSAVGRE